MSLGMGDCQKRPPNSITSKWPSTDEVDFCGEWRDKSITPEQEQRVELVTQFALAIVGSDCDATGARWKPDTVWRMAEEYVDAKPKIGGES